MNKTPIAVLLSDVHYSIQTLEVADKATRMAVDKANILDVPLVVCGDLHDTKANLRGECVKAMIRTFSLARLQPYILRGNHDAINERSKEHSLEFLRGIAAVVDEPRTYLLELHSGRHVLGHLIPYYHNSEDLRRHLDSVRSSCLIMHQGIVGSEAGHYIQDKSALTKEDLAGRRVISGHYHRRQTIDLPDGGKFDYVGNPYTLGFGEAFDPEKGFQILFSDHSMEFVPTGLRKHVVIQAMVDDRGAIYNGPARFSTEQTLTPEDIVMVRLAGPSQGLTKVKKEFVGYNFNLKVDFRLDLVPVDSGIKKIEETKDLSQAEILDSIIESSANSEDQKQRLKNFWRFLCT